MHITFLSILLLVLVCPSIAATEERSVLRQKVKQIESTTETVNLQTITAHLNQQQQPHKNTTVCARLGELPEECHCHEPGHHQIKIECLKLFNSTFFNDTIGLVIDLDPCNDEGSKLDVDLIELNHNIHYTIAGISAGDEADYPIPGLAVIVPGVGHIGLDLAVLIEGNPDMLRIQLGLDACIAMPSRTLCAESIPGLNRILPWYVLSGNYTFSDICEQELAQKGEDEQLWDSIATTA